MVKYYNSILLYNCNLCESYVIVILTIFSIIKIFDFWGLSMFLLTRIAIHRMDYITVNINYNRQKNSAQSRNRTNDTRIFSPLLYQLSYLGTKLREMDLNHRPPGYEPGELPDCSIPRYYIKRWAVVDSNHRSNLQQIYSLSPLATRETAHNKIYQYSIKWDLQGSNL